MCVLFFCVFCFLLCFKQKTAYEMRISDWSSDVCSSDLPRLLPPGTAFEAPGDAAAPFDRDDQHRRRPEGMPADSEQRARATTIEQHPQRRDIAGGADLLVLDDDPRDESVERRIGQRPRMSRHPLRQHLPRIALRQDRTRT